MTYIEHGEPYTMAREVNQEEAVMEENMNIVITAQHSLHSGL